MFRFLELSALSFTLQGKEKRGAEDWVNNWSCLRDEVSVKIPKLWGAESFQVSEHVHSLGGWCAPFPRGQKPLCLGPSRLCLMYFFIWLFICIPYDTLKWAFPGVLRTISANYCTREEGIMRIPVYSQSEAQMTAWNLRPATEAGSVLCGWVFNLRGLHQVWLVCVRSVGYPAAVCWAGELVGMGHSHLSEGCE